MESNPVLPADPSAELETAPQGALVVHNGRLRGTKRALGESLTLLGRDPVCDFYLNVPEVNPFHCAVVRTPSGYVLRDLGSESGTRINGETIQQATLRSGDVLSVGPFEFSVELPEEIAPPSPGSLQAERDAVRIQAAAVAAQQAGLAEEECQFRQRRKILQRQKEQLAAHLDERRKELLTLREQARRDRATLKSESDEARRQLDELRDALGKEREVIRVEKKETERERRRFVELRKRLKKRWRKHWQAHEAALQRREREVQEERARIAAAAESVERERVKLAQAQLRHNGEMELGRRQLQDEWQQLGLAQQQWETCLNQEEMERARRIHERQSQTEQERKYGERCRQAEELQGRLRRETEGLEARIRNQRVKLLEHERIAKELEESRALEDATELPIAPVVRIRQPDVPRVLSRLAEDLADQRRHLLEQWQCLLELYEQWEPERSALLVQFEAAARELVRVEQRLAIHEQALQGREAELQSRQHALLEVRGALEAWQARLTARETFLDNERVMLFADVQTRQELADGRAQRLEEMRQRHAKRRNQEVKDWHVALSQHEWMRHEYLLLWQECQNRRTELIRERRELTGKSLALEQFRQELLGRAEDTPEADKRLQRLVRHYRASIKAEARDVERERAALQAETERLDAHSNRLFDREEENVEHHEAWMRQVAAWEERQASSADLEQRRQQELRHWQLLHDQGERQLATLRDEVERIAGLLLEEPEVSRPHLAA